MSKATIARSLMWKDGKTLLPLLLAVCAGIIGIHFAILLVAEATSGRQSIDQYTLVWVLMPNLVAIGAPALLVGGEEESGTLNWLRTLPVTWQKVVDSKFIVALLAVVGTWLFASLVLTIAALGLGVTARDVYSHDLLQPVGVAKLAFFSFMLLSLGFATAYLFRSPIAALIALVPVIVIAYPIAHATIGWIFAGRFDMAPIPDSASAGRWFMSATVAIVMLFSVWLIQRLLGRRRLSGPERTRRLVETVVTARSAYAPPRSLGLQRPNQIVALLWQQSRQVALPAALITLIAAAGIAVRYSLGNGVPISDVSSLVIMLSALWLGSLAFYGDSVRRRCAFFADRGIAPTRIWWTRLLFPGICCVALALLATGLPASGTGVPMSGPLIIAAFAFGQLVSIWVTRPVLAFFASPAYMMLSATVFAFFYSIYFAYAWTMVFTAPVLLFATWRFTSRWLNGERDFRFHGRVVAYTLVGLFVPMMVVIGMRYATTPALRPEWRAKAMAATADFAKSNLRPFGSGTTGSSFHNASGAGYDITQLADLREHQQVEKLKQLLKVEIESPSIGEDLGFSDVVNVVNKHLTPEGLSTASFAELKRDAIAVLLKWDGIIRQNVIDGSDGLNRLENTAERAEALVVSLLTNEDAPPELKKWFAGLVAMIPSEELRRESRIRGLLQEWRSFQQPRSYKSIAGDEFFYPRNFLGHTLSRDLPLLSVEQRRSERFVDEATRFTLQQLEQGLPRAGSLELRERNELWFATLSPETSRSGYYRAHPLVGGNWTQTHEDAVRKLRERYPSQSKEE